MHTRREKPRRRSRSVPLSLVPALAALVGATGCSNNAIDSIDPCEPGTYTQAACDTAVVHHGYWYGGTWYPHVYPYAPIWYYSRYTGFIGSGGRVRTISPTVYAPSVSTPARPNVVRGGFGGIGEGFGAAGS
jgi:hypothetical protein